MLPALLFFVFSSAQAEYRAFELVITNKETGTEQVILHSLDPDQYRAYYPLQPNEQISYRSTWRCRGDTSFLRVCPKPENLNESPSP